VRAMLRDQRYAPHTSSDVAGAQRVGTLSIDGFVRPCRFRHMQWFLPRLSRQPFGRATGICFVLGLVAACERTPPPAGRKDTTVPVVPPPETTVVTPPPTSTWDSAAGRALFVVGAAPGEALIIAPRYSDSTALDSASFDLTTVRAVQLDLFASGKRVGSARVGETARSIRTDSCRTWPTARLGLAVADTSATKDWNVAFEAGHAAEVALDSITALPAADSGRLAAEIARLASALPGDTSAVFRGLPFVVNKAWRTRAPNGPQLLIAVVVRNVNQEANPRQERILLIAERDSATGAGRYTTKYSERAAGLEETLEATDPLAIVLLGAERRPTLVVARDAGHGASFALIERIAGEWQRRWSSTYAGC
jgi:hypothetical protein